jgi:serine phosphatase RsbU (regulator of sigma subunit)
LLFTDGISDARNTAGERFGEDPVLHTVASYRTEAPSSIANRVFTMLNQHIGDTPLSDDLALVVLRN